MCNENLNTILSLDFSSVNDEGNWLHDSSNVLQTIDNKLTLDPDSNSTSFTRQIGNVDNSNNRIKINCNFEVEKTDASGPDNMEVLFQLWNSGQMLFESYVEFDNLSEGVNYVYFLDRTYKIDYPLSTPISLKILIPEGWQHKLFLKDLDVFDFNFCEDNVRSYFVIDELLEDSLTSQSSGIQLEEWKVDNNETLTTEFFNENNSVGGNPLTEWKFAKADLDGNNRISENTQPNSFNPFVDEFGLDFDTATSFYGGKSTGVTSGSDYGQGILSIGLLKPAILNGNLSIKKGAFFIDIDYTKSLKIVFNVIVNQNSSNVFTRPTYFRKYFIEWNALTCEKKYYYIDQKDQSEVDQLVNGFLSGLTGVEINETIVSCDETFSPSGNVGNFSYVLDFGDNIGTAGINYNAYSVPDRFIIEWNGQTFDTGFVGSSSYDAQLITAGVNPSDINTGSPSTGSGMLTFNKSQAFPTQATITVLAPLGGTAWNVTGICPQPTQGSEVEVGEGGCNTTPSSWDTVFINDANPSSYVPSNGDIVYSDIDLTTPFNGGNDTFRMRVTSGPFQLILNYSFKIDVNGVISDVFICKPIGGGGEIQISNNSSNNCYSCMTFTVNVPQGETREVEISSNFAPSGVHGGGFCNSGTSATIINSDLTETISQSKTYTVGIDGASGGGSQQTSTITIRVKNNGVTTDTETLSRTHANINC
ncbi:hypothetical protein PL373_13665 [Tenacibaculum maritimum]|nr:hypothetical protein [Tenacibaculum maritimum]MDB0602177.1 hypothetical protein [Tenacibaculum maritimum]MDB0613853.1 hypothetical protein [Tenacibaculum maritimum]